MTDDDRQQPHKAANKSISMPTEIMEEILLRLPVKSILRFRAVSKQWHSFISHPSFIKLHFTLSTSKSLHTSLLIAGFDWTSKRQFLGTAPHNGGPVMAFWNDYRIFTKSKPQHLNGLVLFTTNGLTPGTNYPYVYNPSTRKSYKLTVPIRTDYKDVETLFFFGFDESINEHKILNIKIFDPFINAAATSDPEFMIFSLSNYSWRKIDVEKLPVGITMAMYFHSQYIDSVCVNSVIHLIFDRGHNSILAFDLKTETFSVINLACELDWDDGLTTKPSLMNINGLLGAVSFHKIKELRIWILQDYEKRTWVKGIVPLSEPLWTTNTLYCPYPLGCTNLEEIVCSQIMLSNNVMSLRVYDVKTGCINLVKFTLGDGFLHSNSNEVLFNKVISYVECMLPLRED